MKSKRRNRAFPIGRAIFWGIAATFVTGIVILLILLTQPNSAARLFIDLNLYHGNSNLRLSPLYQQIQSTLAYEELLIVSPLCMLMSGLAIGFAMRKDYTAKHIATITGIVAFAQLLLYLALPWGVTLASEKFHVNPNEFPLRLIVAQAVCLILWTGVAVIGGEIGRRLGRDSKSVPAS